MSRSDNLSFDNNYRARNNQNNNNKNRNRNRNRRPGGGNGGNTGGTGNAPNRVYESAGPDVKVRGTAQTVAEKYHQLGRDAQSSGDNVMAESYYQHAEHYYRIWASNQPAGQTLQAFRKPGDEGFEEEVEDNGDGEHDNGNQESDADVQAESTENSSEQPTENGEPNQQRQFRQRDNRDNREPREGSSRERYKSRWQNRRDSAGEERVGETTDVAVEAEVSHHGDAQSILVSAPQENTAVENDRWEVPSFLARPVPVLADEVVHASEQDEPVRERKPRAPRKPRVVADVVAADDSDADT